jgi:predicted AAA+ superfamily ATPase
MVMANHERLQKCLIELRDGLRPFCEQTWSGFYGDDWLATVNATLKYPDTKPSSSDLAFLLKAIGSTWQEIWRHQFGQAERNLISEMVGIRNRHAHNEQFSTDDTYRALDTIERVLEAFGAKEQLKSVRAQRNDLLRQRFEEESRAERRKTAAKPTEGEPLAGLTPWREVITPHSDVAAGRFEQAEFAADLFDVASGDADEEYQDPVAFFRRTFLTEGLRKLLLGAARRLSGAGGDPVVELQTNFGGGKTHSLIALYHLACGRPPGELPGVAELLAEESIVLPDKVNRAVFVGQMVSPAAPRIADDGTAIHTIWGDIAHQLGGKDGYALVEADDRAGTNPGAKLRELFKTFGPAVVLIDEWVAYARQLPTTEDAPRLAGGDFDTQFTFAQALTEAAAAVDDVVVLVSIPASDIEVGGERGRDALERLKNVVTRKAAQWQPASPDESFEIVRRRLFDPITPEQARVRDGVIRAFSDFYRDRPKDFPTGVSEAEYRRRMELSYPIHPELFDRLFEDWSTLDKFQRTRGVLRLMAVVISELWKRDDRSLMIMPGTLPIDSAPVLSELTKYLEEGWDPVIKTDVDGPNALPLRLDQENKHFGRYSAARRTARAVYMGSAPRPDTNRGVDIKSVLLGCAQPGEPPAQFADALRRLSSDATHLYVDGNQYWYALQPNVTRLAADRAASNYGDDQADDEIRRRLITDRNRGPFAAVHVFPDGSGDVPDDEDGVRLVVLPPTAIHIPNADDSPAVALAGDILDHRSGGRRLYRNLLVFLAASGPRLEELRAATRLYLAWKSILADTETLNLSPHQQRQTNTKLAETDNTVTSRIDETFVHVLTPRQTPGTADIEWQVTKPSGAGAIAERVARKLTSEEKLISTFGGVRVRMDLDRIPLWSERGDIGIGELWDAYAKLPYMARLASFDVLANAISDGTALLNWAQESFAYADGHNGTTWVGVRQVGHIQPARSGFLVNPDALPDEGSTGGETEDDDEDETGGDDDTQSGGGSKKNVPKVDGPAKTRFYARFELDRVRAIRQLEDILANVTNHLEGSVVNLTLEVNARTPKDEGYDDRTRRVVSENATQLGAESAEFE